MVVTSYTSPGTTANVDRGDWLWENTDYAKVDDTNRTITTVDKTEYGDWLRVTNFGFTIPEGATIDGIEFQIIRQAGDTDMTDSDVHLLKTSGQVGDNAADASDWSVGSDETITYGGATEKFGTTWTYGEINSSDFGVDISPDNGNAFNDQEARINHVQIRIYYTESTTGTNTQINIGDTWKDISAAKINIGDTWKEVAAMQINIGDDWKVVF